MARIAVGGWHHETSTFAPTKATYEDFEKAGGWPGLSRGPALLEALQGINIPICGFLDAARADGHALVPLLWCEASPSAHVANDAYERIASMMLEDLKRVLPVDALYLDLHGAMVTEHLEDGEGELLARIRKRAGPGLPIFVSLDFHANVTPAMAKHATALVAFRTYPHVDMAETGLRTASLMSRALKGEPVVRHKAYRQLPFLIPISWQCTLIEPAVSLYRDVGTMERDPIGSISVPLGFPLADIHDCGPTVQVYGADERAVNRAADRLAQMVLEREGDFAGKLWQPEEAVRHAMEVARKGRGKPVILADTQDNPGAGADSDTTGLLRALVKLRAEGAVVAMVNDPVAARAAHAAGEGSEINIGLGEGSRLPGHAPFQATYKVERAVSGSFTATGPFYAGSRMKIGPMALLNVGGVRVVVSSLKQQCADQEMLRHVGLEPKDQRILALKSSVHFRADFQPLAEEILVVAAPGPSIADSALLDFKRLRIGVRTSPLGKPFRHA
ncbi:MAG: M81 family metallopeptidase [Alphaproteobacteria bacterium]